jgi:hypothetical protein
MPKVGYYELRDKVQLNMPTETKIDCETLKRKIIYHLARHWSLICNCDKELATAVHF